MQIKIINEDQTSGQFIVGGHVRDSLLGRPSQDLDYVIVGSSVEEMEAKGFKSVGKSFPVFLDGNKDLALARKERKVKPGYQGFECDTEGVTLKDDLARRDLTVNSIAMIEEGVYYDPFNGLKDLENRILRHTTEAFKEDPVRVLRIARFYARYEDFTIAKETKELILELKDELNHLTKERVALELKKVMSENRPELFFMILRDLDVLDVLFPEIHAMIGCEHDNEYHLEGDVFNHTMMVLIECCKLTTDVNTRLGALYHDIAKPIVKLETGLFHDHAIPAVIDKEIEKLKDRLRLGKETFLIIRQAAVYHHFMHNFLKINHHRIAGKFFEKGFPSSIEDLTRLYTISQADSCGRLVLLDNKSVSGSEVSEYNDKLKGLILNSFLEMKKVSPKEFISQRLISTKESPSVDSIKNFIHNERINIFNKHKSLFVNPNNFILIHIDKFNGIDTDNLLYLSKVETDDSNEIHESLNKLISSLYENGQFSVEDDLFKFDNGFECSAYFEFITEKEYFNLFKYCQVLHL